MSILDTSIKNTKSRNDLRDDLRLLEECGQLRDLQIEELRREIHSV